MKGKKNIGDIELSGLLSYRANIVEGHPLLTKKVRALNARMNYLAAFTNSERLPPFLYHFLCHYVVLHVELIRYVAHQSILRCTASQILVVTSVWWYHFKIVAC